MKKTILALGLVGLFSAPLFTTNAVTTDRDTMHSNYHMEMYETEAMYSRHSDNNHMNESSRSNTHMRSNRSDNMHMNKERQSFTSGHCH